MLFCLSYYKRWSENISIVLAYNFSLSNFCTMEGKHDIGEFQTQTMQPTVMVIF